MKLHFSRRARSRNPGRLPFQLFAVLLAGCLLLGSECAAIADTVRTDDRTYGRGGFKITKTDRHGRVTREFWYDRRDRLRERKSYVVNRRDLTQTTTTFQYDAGGRLRRDEWEEKTLGGTSLDRGFQEYDSDSDRNGNRRIRAGEKEEVSPDGTRREYRWNRRRGEWILERTVPPEGRKSARKISKETAKDASRRASSAASAAGAKAAKEAAKKASTKPAKKKPVTKGGGHHGAGHSD